MVFLVSPGTRLPSRHISSWSWPAVATRPSALITARARSRPRPSSCPTDLTTQRAVLWVTRPPHHTLLQKPCWQIPQWKQWPQLLFSSFTLRFPSAYLSSDWVRSQVGGRLAAVSHRSGPRHRAPDGTELLPRQVISGGDATAQDVSTHLLNTETMIK